MLLTVNAEIVDTPDCALSIVDRGFHLGDGVFETLRIYGGRPFGLRDHLDRLAAACERTAINIHRDHESVIHAEIERALRSGLHEAFMRITVSRGAGLGLGADSPECTMVTLIDELPKLDPRWYTAGISVVITPGRRNEFAVTAGIKTTAYLDSIIAFRAARQDKADDALFLDTKGHLSEATASNLFIVREGSLHTPPLTCGALPGITRANVIRIAEAQGIDVGADRALEAEELRTAEEMFLTSSIREIVPVISCGWSRVGDGKPGPVTRRLIAAYAGMTR